MKWVVIILGAALILVGVLIKRNMTEDERLELEMRRSRRQAAISDFSRPLSERAASALVFLLSPTGLIIAGAVLIVAGALW